MTRSLSNFNFNDKETYDVIVHSAENPNITHYKKINPSNKSNFEKLHSKCKTLIYLSSCAVYEKNRKEPARENSVKFEDSWYAKNKLDSEKYALANKGTVLRLSNVYGPRMRKNVITDIITTLENRNKILIFNPEAKRHFLHINDLIELIRNVVTNPKEGVFNVCGNNMNSAYKIAQIVKKIYLKDEAQIICSGVTKKDTLLLSNEKIKANYDWEPKISLECGLKKLIKKT